MENLYNENDMELFQNRIEGIMKNIEDKVSKYYDPTYAEIETVQKIILDFAKEKKRKMYGGFGLHLAIKNKNNSASFYKVTELFFKDIDLYCTDKLFHINRYDVLTISKIFMNWVAFSLKYKHKDCPCSFHRRNVSAPK